MILFLLQRLIESLVDEGLILIAILQARILILKLLVRALNFLQLLFELLDSILQLPDVLLIIKRAVLHRIG